MHRLTWLLILLFAGFGYGAESPFPETQRVDDKIKELDQMPVAAEFRSVSESINAIHRERDKSTAGLQEKLAKIHNSEEYKIYRQKRQELESQRQGKWDVERKALAEAARTIYSARHAEIKRIARVKLSSARKLGFDVLTYPRVDGSTSTGPLGVIVASRILDVPYEWIYPEPTGYSWHNRPDVSEYFLSMSGRAMFNGDSEFMLATLRVVAKPERKEQERIALMINSILAASSSTHAAYVNLILGKCDVNLTARPPSESELKLAKEKNVNIKMVPIALDAFVMIVNHKNTVPGLTRQQVREIYEGKITNWKSVEGNDAKISAFRRERDSGSRELFDALVMQGQSLPDGENYRQLYGAGMGGPFSQVTQNAVGLGYSIYYYEHFMAASPFTRTLAIDGVEPTAETIASGKYPWVTRIYATYRDGDAADSPGLKLIHWLLSEEGQSVVRESGYIPVQ